MAKPVAVAKVVSTSSQVVEIAYATWNGGTTVALTGADSTVTAPATAIASYKWVLVQKPTGSSAALSADTIATPTLNGVDTAGTYRIMLVVTDNNSGGAETSENDLLKAPKTAFIKVRASTRYLGLLKPATGERDWTDGYHEVVDAVDALENTKLATVATATTSVLGLTKLAEAPADAANPKAVTQDRGCLSVYVLGLTRSTEAEGPEFLPTIGLADVSSISSKALFCSRLGPATTYTFESVTCAMSDAGDGSSGYRFDFYIVSDSEYAANSWAASAFASVTVPQNSTGHGPNIASAVLPGTLPTSSGGKNIICVCAQVPSDLGTGLTTTINWAIKY
jgi:hypothetical protein